MVHICDKRYSLRSEENTQIRVYTNQERVTLFVNGEEMAVNEVKKRHVASFPISLSGGKMQILVKAGDVWDSVTIERVEKSRKAMYSRKPVRGNKAWQTGFRRLVR